MRIRYVVDRTVEVADFAAFKAQFPDAVAIEVDDKDVIGLCEVCEKPVLEGDNYVAWEECITCETCSDPGILEAQQEAVTDDPRR